MDCPFCDHPKPHEHGSTSKGPSTVRVRRGSLFGRAHSEARAAHPSRRTLAELLKLAIDPTQWQGRNVFVVSVLWDKRAMPIYWQVLPKGRCSNLAAFVPSSGRGEQKALLRPVFRLLKHYKIILTSDREFHSVKLANWLVQRRVLFALRQKKGTYIQQQGQKFQRLETLGLKPGVSLYISQV